MFLLMHLVALWLLLTCTRSGLAHVLTAPVPRSIGWNWQPWILASLGIGALWYAAGLMRLRRRMERRRVNGGAGITAFFTGLATVFTALVSPLDSIADQLFWIHMIQHLLLLLISAPLLVLGRPAVIFLWAFARVGRKRIGYLWAASHLHAAIELLMQPLVVWLLFCGIFVFWHFPGPYQWALQDERIHTLEHLSFLLTALMFWSIVIEPSGRRRLEYGPTLVFVMTAAILSALPGALIALSPRPLYPAHAEGAAAWGLTPLQDQQLAGIVMWIPGGFVYLLAAVLVFLKWLQNDGRRRVPLPKRALLNLLILCAVLPLLASCDEQPSRNAVDEPRRGVSLIKAYGCGSCHSIPGVVDANGVVGPPLTQIGRRIYIAGLLRNTPDNLIAWIRHPQSIAPGNVMPEMGISEDDARAIAKYLSTLR